MNPWLLSCLVTAPVAAVAAAEQDTATTTAFVNVTVVPMDHERVLTSQTVLVQGGRVTVLGPTSQVKVPAGVVRIDGKGKYLIPGLADMHTHIPSGTSFNEVQAEHMLFLWLANGVTTVRMMHGGKELLRLKGRATIGELLSPRMYVAGDVGQLPPLASAETLVASLKAEGYDLVKWVQRHTGKSEQETAAFVAFAAAARRAGLPGGGHVSPTKAIAAQIASIEHLFGFSELLTGISDWGRSWKSASWNQMAQQPLDGAKLREVATQLRQAGVWNCPTQLLYELNQLSADSMVHWPEMRYVSESTRADMRMLWATNSPTDSLPAARPAIAARRQVIKALHEAGAGLLLGTDAPAFYMLPGFAVHRELEALVKSGLTPYQALETGTRNPATYFGTLDSTGTVAVGKRADLVLLNGNPLTDIRYTAQPAGVMLGGRWLARAELDRRLAAVEGKAF